MPEHRNNTRGEGDAFPSLRYANFDIVCQEVPGEVSLALNISGCPCRCPQCHSKYLWQDAGETLTPQAIDELMANEARGVTCVLFMGGDASPATVNALASHVRRRHPGIKTAWYSGRSLLSPLVDKRNFHYIKLGPYISHLGPLNSPTTNQRFYRINPGGQDEDLTELFRHHHTTPD